MTLVWKYGLLVCGLLSLCSSTLAQGPHSVRRASIGYLGELHVDITEAGGATMNYTVTADAVAVYQCLGENLACPASVNRQEVSTATQGTATLKAVATVGPVQGLISARITAPVPGVTLLCEEDSVEEESSAILMSVHYSNILLHNTTMGTQGSARPSALSATFHTCP